MGFPAQVLCGNRILNSDFPAHIDYAGLEIKRFLWAKRKAPVRELPLISHFFMTPERFL